MKQKLSLIATLFISTYATLSAATDIYVVTNKADGNTIAHFKDDKGTFAMVAEYSSGGTGTGDLEIPALEKNPDHPLANGDDPLISANAIRASADGDLIVSVNPGDATIALSERQKGGKLALVNTAKASDLFPISVDISGDLVVAASVGDNNGSGSIALYQIKGGKLMMVADSRRDLKARPSTISFSTNGEFVYVNELVTGKVKVFGIENDNLTESPISSIDSPRAEASRFQAIPVGFDVRGDNNKDVILMSEARFLTPDFKLREGNGEVVQSPLYSWQTGSLSTYTVDKKGQIAAVSQDVLTGSNVEGDEIANCWVALSPDGNTLWAANALSSSISSFSVSKKGDVTLKNDVAYKDSSETAFYSDMTVSHDGKHLYQLVGNQGAILVFDIKSNGDLTLNQQVGGMPELGTYGMLALD
ncbi:lactonase family protein [Grimontia sp. S25]|uniref:Lactonase family protein n=1 Tax=Grimontia sedimenti TaxID=2711294 RepID=A0A6M1RCK3_9GAMM|nr:beta-propeller fold lactonase family protein [Grimontia sedimenti]NGN97994.1 lactonase family protein [Grimontia sedimenti]